MGEIPSSVSRLFAGYATLGAFAWLLWPSDLAFLAKGDALLAFISAFLIWHWIEIRSLILSKKGPSINDVRVARDILSFHSGYLRSRLKEDEQWSYTPSTYYYHMNKIIHDREIGTLLFNDKGLDKLLAEFVDEMARFKEKIAQDTVPEKIGGTWRTGYKPFDTVSEDEYQRRRRESKEADKIADRTWIKLEILSNEVKKKLPTSLDSKITPFYPKED